jgi:tryptophanyl-tRNA synthetase
LLTDPGHIEQVMRKGAEKARAVSRPMLAKARAAVGIKPLTV